MILGTRSCWRSSSPSKCGDSDWRERRYLTRCGPTTKTWSTYTLPKGSVGPIFLEIRLTAYRPGSKNVKPDALSCYFEGNSRTEDLETILRPEMFLSAVEMDIKRQVREAAGTETAPSGCLGGRHYVPRQSRAQVLQWGHAS